MNHLFEYCLGNNHYYLVSLHDLSLKQNHFPIFVEVEHGHKSTNFILKNSQAFDLLLFVEFLYNFQSNLIERPINYKINKHSSSFKHIYLKPASIDFLFSDKYAQLYAPLDLLYVIKCSHIYNKFETNNVYKFDKTMLDLKLLSELLFNQKKIVFCFSKENFNKNLFSNEIKQLNADKLQDFYLARVEYSNDNFKRPNLDVDKNSFFKKEEDFYKYDHDSIHELVAVKNKPAYLSYMRDNCDVMTSKEKFFNCDYETQILGIVEEAMTLACERVLFNDGNENIALTDKKLPVWAFMFCLKKVCSTITGGYFREFSYIHFDEAVNKFWEINPIGNEYWLKVVENKDKLKSFSV